MIFLTCLRKQKPKFPNLHGDIVLLRFMPTLWGNGVSVNTILKYFHKYINRTERCCIMLFHTFYVQYAKFSIFFLNF